MHDEKYLAAPTQIAGCDCNKADYKDTVANGVVTCTAGQAACAALCCEADKAIVECVAGGGPLDRAHTAVDRANVCAPLECRVDDDCDPGMYCNGGTCRMYCDPGLASCHAPTEAAAGFDR